MSREFVCSRLQARTIVETGCLHCELITAISLHAADVLRSASGSPAAATLQ
jgi:hypothetical protein